MDKIHLTEEEKQKFMEEYDTLPLDQYEKDIMEEMMSPDYEPKRDEKVWARYQALVKKSKEESSDSPV